MLECFKNLELYAQNGKNVLLIGESGVGKTEYIKTLFNKLFDKKWKYFSSSTIDVFLDFLGIPRDVVDGNGIHYIEYVKPKWHQLDVEAIFFDEFNRSSKQLRNAVLELLQFKSLNGEKFGNLKTIFAAINPYNDANYSDVDALDKAQLDRFEIHIHVPYILDYDYFKNKYGEYSADAISEWWEDLDNDQKRLCSPRRLEYALNILKIGGSLKEVFHEGLNTKKLDDLLRHGAYSTRVSKLFDKNDEEIVNALKSFNILNYIVNNIDKPKYIETFAKFLPEDYLIQTVSISRKLCNFIKNNVRLFNENLLKTLNSLEAFKDSNLTPAFSILATEFRDTSYISSKKKSLTKVLELLPSPEDITDVRIIDKNHVQKLIGVLNNFEKISRRDTIREFEKKYDIRLKIDIMKQKLSNKNINILD